MQTTEATTTKPNGPVAAVFLAAGIGSLVMGIFVVLNEVSEDISNFLKFDANFGLGSGVGPLSGKATLAILAFLGSWLILGLLLRGKEVKFGPVLTIALILVAGGFLLTFPPVFEIFAPA
ncbi:MAG: hypothetical protein MUF63_18115 [Rhodobacteraceae bacterium]|jgi:hypothetical protein|nr:hypothetical protein [Paracoccaceae bacterium]